MIEAALTLASVPAILAVVNLAKDLGLPTKAALVVAVVLGVAFSVAESLFGQTEIYAAVSSGLILGLGAAGVYDVTRHKPTDPTFKLIEK